jgi:hypothetical protein
VDNKVVIWVGLGKPFADTILLVLVIILLLPSFLLGCITAVISLPNWGKGVLGRKEKSLVIFFKDTPGVGIGFILLFMITTAFLGCIRGHGLA